MGACCLWRHLPSWMIESCAFRYFKHARRQHVSVFCCWIQCLLRNRCYSVPSIPGRRYYCDKIKRIQCRAQAPVGGDCNRCRDHDICRFQGNGVCLDLSELMDECLNDVLIAGLITPWIRGQWWEKINYNGGRGFAVPEFVQIETHVWFHCIYRFNID